MKLYSYYHFTAAGEPNEPCSDVGMLVPAPSTITSLGFRHSYAHGLTCRWFIKAPPTNVSQNLLKKEVLTDGHLILCSTFPTDIACTFIGTPTVTARFVHMASTHCFTHHSNHQKSSAAAGLLLL